MSTAQPITHATTINEKVIEFPRPLSATTDTVDQEHSSVHLENERLIEPRFGSNKFAYWLYWKLWLNKNTKIKVALHTHTALRFQNPNFLIKSGPLDRESRTSHQWLFLFANIA